MKERTKESIRKKSEQKIAGEREEEKEGGQWLWPVRKKKLRTVTQLSLLQTWYDYVIKCHDRQMAMISQSGQSFTCSLYFDVLFDQIASRPFG